MTETRHIFWTGGFDSTYYVLRSLSEGFQVQPHYIQKAGDGRECAVQEVRTIEHWRTWLQSNKPELWDLLKPPTIVGKVPEEKGVREDWKRAGAGNKPSDLVGWQYEAMSRLALSFDMFDVACCAEHGGRLQRNLEAVKKLPGADRLTFPLVDTTKEEMLAWSQAHGFDLSPCWSCWHPKDGEPCGKCRMCRERIVPFKRVTPRTRTKLSLIFNVCNRSRAEAGERILRLFPNCLYSVLQSLIGFPGGCQVVIVDWGSTDWPLEDWLPQLFRQFPDVRYDLVQPDGVFNRGEGRNIGAASSIGEVLCFIDADMLVTSGQFFRDGFDVASHGRPVFPICYNFNNAQWSKGCWRGGESSAVRGAGSGSSGNVFINRSQWQALGGFKTKGDGFERWGRTDIDFRKRAFRQFGRVERRKTHGFYHQWHPTDPAWLDQNIPAEVGADHKTARKGRWADEPLPADAVVLNNRGDYLGDLVERFIIGGRKS